MRKFQKLVPIKYTVFRQSRKLHIPTRLNLIHSRCNPHLVKFNPLLAKSLPLSAGSNIPLAEFSSLLAKSHPLSARSHPWLGLFCSIQLDLTIFWVNPSHTSVQYYLQKPLSAKFHPLSPKFNSNISHLKEFRLNLLHQSAKSLHISATSHLL